MSDCCPECTPKWMFVDQLEFIGSRPSAKLHPANIEAALHSLD
jgi:hypothetical protein